MAMFERLIQELEAGGTTLNTFGLWEIELLLDIESCILPTTRRGAVLKSYQKAAKHPKEEGS